MADEVTLDKVYEEGVKKLLIFPIDANGDYGSAYELEGLMTVEVPITQTTEDLYADDGIYRARASLPRGEGTITVVGLKRTDYQALYDNIVDSNGALVFGRTNQSKMVGLGFYNTINGESAVAEQYTFMPKVKFSLPNLSHTTKTDDNTEIRSFEISVVAYSVEFETAGGTKDRYIAAAVNEIDDSTIYEDVNGTAYVPDSTL